MIKKNEIRVRFSPSPTGYLHVGSARTALFNFLFAKNRGGTFVLRIEDTDKERSKLEFEKDILDSLAWLGIEYDEGPGKEGKYGPYKQSERTEIYKKYLEKLLKENKAYRCFCLQDALEAERQEQISSGIAPHYSARCSRLSDQDIKDNMSIGKKYTIRLRTHQKKLFFDDVVRGKVEFDTSLFGDFILAKDLDTPLYNFTATVDDYEMGVTHIIRGEDHISNTPKQILIHEALGFDRRYVHAHISLILNQDKSKLSKRDGSVAVTQYKEDGYLPETLINFLALLGWNPGTDQEIYSLEELIKDFSLEKIHKGGAVFNVQKLDYFNGFYIRRKSLQEITMLCMAYWEKTGLIQRIGESFVIKDGGEQISFSQFQAIVSLYKERLKKLSEISEFTDYFFRKNLSYPKELLIWKGTAYSDLVKVFQILYDELNQIKMKDWTAKNLENILLKKAEEVSEQFSRKGDRGFLLWPLRVSLTGKKSSAGPFEVAETLGINKSLERIKKAQDLISL